MFATEVRKKRKSSKQNFIKKYEWLQKKKIRLEEKRIPKEVDGIDFRDTELPEEFRSEPRVYGGVIIDETEKELLSLPPKFFTFKKLDPTRLKAEVEKSFMKLRWQQALATDNKGDNQADENEEEEGGSEFYDDLKRTFDLTTVPATNVPFNKRATMPPYADEDTEAKIAFARKRLHSSIEDQCRKSKGAENLSDNAKKGLKQIKKRLKDKQVVCFPTDKSGRMSIDNPMNYSKSMLKHFDGMSKTNLENYY